MIKLTTIIFLFSSFLLADSTVNSNLTYDLLLAPPAYDIDIRTKVVPVDILTNSVVWHVSENLKSTKASAKLKFQIGEDGYPFLMLNPNTTLKLNGLNVDKVKIESKPFIKSNYYYIDKKLKPGEVYILEAEYRFESDNKNSHFLPQQYYKNSFVEHGIPCNGHQDHFSLNLNVKLLGNSDAYSVFTNGNMKITKEGIREIIFPKEFTSASFYIDIDRKDNVISKEKVLSSIDRRKIPLFVYTKKGDADMEWVKSFIKAIEFVFSRLEHKFGPYPYDKIVFNVTNRNGGGAYAGAMALPLEYIEHLTHELGHSWFSHSVSPASGNDYWIFEGLGNWAPIYRTGVSELNKNYKNFADLRKNQYDLWKPNWKPFDAHRDGSAILGSIDKKIRISGGPFKDKGLIPVLKEIYTRKKGNTMSTDQFRVLLNDITRLNFDHVFDYYFLDYNKCEACYN